MSSNAISCSVEGPKALHRPIPTTITTMEAHSARERDSLTPGTQPRRARTALKTMASPKIGAITEIGAMPSATTDRLTSDPVFMRKPSHQSRRQRCVQLGRSGRPASVSAERFMMSKATLEMSADRAASETPTTYIGSKSSPSDPLFVCSRPSQCVRGDSGGGGNDGGG